jgi:hypothetical protein
VHDSKHVQRPSNGEIVDDHAVLNGAAEKKKRCSLANPAP